jgi:signal transduction histidine kinase/ActR/RegA family two-component response regulator
MSFVRNFYRKYPLRTQVIVAFLMIGLTALSLSLFYIRITRTALIGQANQALFAAASRTATSLDAFLHANLDTIRTEAALPPMVDYMSLPVAQRQDSMEESVMLETLETLGNEDLFYIASYGLLDQQGINLLDTNAVEIGTDESEHEYFQAPLRTGRPFVSPVRFAEKVGGVYFYFSSPVRNRVGQIVGVLRVRYSVALLQKLVAESKGLAGEQSYAILLDENTMRLAQDAAPEMLFTLVTPLDADRLTALRLMNRVPNKPESELFTDLPDFTQGLLDADEQPFFTAEELVGEGELEQMAVVPLQEQPWRVVYAQPQAVFLAPVDEAIRVTILWIIVVAVLLIIAAIFISRWLTTPVTHLIAVVEQITAGDLAAQARVESSDEIGRLAVAFNNMTAQLRLSLEGLERREEALQQSNDQLEMTLIELRETQAQMLQQERVAAVGQLAAGIAHDFNNIMATVLLYTDLLLKTSDLSEKDKRRVELVQQQGRRAADLTQQILDFSRKSVMRRQDLDLRLFVAELKQLLERTLPENIHLYFDSVGERVMVHVDPTRLQQVLLNLAINARNAMPDGGELRISLTIKQIENADELSPAVEPGDWAVLTVTDNGTGIPEEVLQHIFEPFFTTRAPLGSGLGLSQVHGIVTQHGGYVDVTTQVGLGTTFKIYLPALPLTILDTAVFHDQTVIQGQGETILLVEDDEHVQGALISSLESLNYCVLSAVNGRDALTLYQQRQTEIDLVLTDLVMPELGGKELLQALHKQNPALKAILLTGYPLSDQAEELRLLGAVAWCQKPVNLEKLSQIVAQSLHAQDDKELSKNNFDLLETGD